MGQHVMIVGATGMVGGHALEMCLQSPDVDKVTVLSRRATGAAGDKLHEVLHTDFLDYAAVREHFAGVDAAIFCIGVYTGTMPDDAFRSITVDVPDAFFKELHRQSPGAVVSFLSGQGADTKESARMAFARYKGMAENALLQHGFARVHIFRPGYIYPVQPRKEPNLSYRIIRSLYPVVRCIYPNVGLPSTDLAAAMVHAALHETPGYDAPVLENRDIRKLVASLA